MNFCVHARAYEEARNFQRLMVVHIQHMLYGKHHSQFSTLWALVYICVWEDVDSQTSLLEI